MHSRAEFHPLVVADVESLTADSAAVRFQVPAELRERFAFSPGQTLTIRQGQLRRSYSICSPQGAAPRIGVREVAGGAVSGWLVHDLRPGDTVEVQAPSGSFTPDLSAPGHHVLIAAGSGITPMLSIAASVLATHSDSTITLIYGNRGSDSVMFADDVADLKDAYTTRMQLVHVLSREAQEVELFSGRLDADRLRRLLPAILKIENVDHWWLCGPFGMITDAVQILAEAGVAPTAIHRELFYVGDDPPTENQHVEAPIGPGAEVTIILDGRRSSVTVPHDVAVLDGAQRARPDLPFACKGGVCGTCRALCSSGEVQMKRNFALEEAEVAAGYVLTCQALPVSNAVTIDFDS